MKKSKIVIYLPFYEKGAGKKAGFLNQDEVEKTEKMLAANERIDFLGNINFKKVGVVGDSFYCENINLKEADLFFWYAPGIKVVFSELKALGEFIPVMKSPKSLETVEDKFYSHAILRANNLPVADYALVGYDDFGLMKKIIKNWGTVLVKPRGGNFGRGITKVSDFETLRDVAGLLMVEKNQRTIFVERFYENELDDWISTTIIGGKVVYGYRKRENKYVGWKVYDIQKKGGDAYYVDPSPVKEVAEKAASILDNSIVGFDFIKTKDGYKIVDENNFPGFYKEAFDDAEADVSELVADLIIKNSQK